MIDINNLDHRRFKYFMGGMSKPQKDLVKTLVKDVGWDPDRAVLLVKSKGAVLPTEDELIKFVKHFDIKQESLYYYIPKRVTNFDKLVEIRKNLGRRYTQAFVAEKSGIKLSTLKSIETGRMSLSDENAEKLSDVYGVPVEAFYSTSSVGTKVIAVVGHKGGCGKTSLSSNLAINLSQDQGLRKGAKVLYIDADFQCNGSMTFGYGNSDESLEEMLAIEKNIYLALTDGKKDIRNHIIDTDYENLDIVLGSPEMSGIEINLYKEGLTPGFTLKRILEPLICEGAYDYIIIDTHATLGITNVNVFNAANELILPLEFSLFGVMGLNGLRDFYNEIVEVTNPNLYITGVVGNNVNKIRTVTKKARNMVNESYRNKILNTSIGIDAKVQDAQFEGYPVSIYDSEATASIEYSILTDEVLRIWDQEY